MIGAMQPGTRDAVLFLLLGSDRSVALKNVSLHKAAALRQASKMRSCRTAFKGSVGPPLFHISRLWRKFFAPHMAMME
jgi:hypothetical protein